MSIIGQRIFPTPADSFQTPTSQEQARVEESIREYVDAYQKEREVKLNGDQTASTSLLKDEDIPVPSLQKAQHMAFLRRVLEPLPGAYVGFDSTRCWLIYWVAHSHALMGQELDERTRSRGIATLIQFQNSVSGGFGGGNRQLGHLMGTYASVMALAILGGPGPCPDEDDIALGLSTQIGKGGWDAVDRPKLYNFFVSLKQPDGSFTVHQDGEIDVRATYCVVCVALMLGIATPELFQGVGDAIAACQTYEGGLSAASQHRAGGEAAVTLGEAHGGYAYCAMAAHLSLSLLSKTGSDVIDGKAGIWNHAKSFSSSKLDIDAVTRWAVQEQGVAIEGGGFKGRTNKLVDGCYGWFSGAGLGTVVAAQLALRDGQGLRESEPLAAASEDGWQSDDAEAESDLFDGFLFDRIALQEYILVVAQAPRGGLRDKPGKNADAYHTCYNLSGLSLSQHRVAIDADVRQSLVQKWKTGTDAEDSWQKSCYLAMLGWSIDPKFTRTLGSHENQMVVTHPIFNVPFTKAKEIMRWSYGQ